MSWLDNDAAHADRLLVPLTNSDGWGGFLLIERHAVETWRYPAQYVSPTGIIHCIGGRDTADEERLKAAMAHSRMADIRSLRAGRDVLACRRGMVAINGTQATSGMTHIRSCSPGTRWRTSGHVGGPDQLMGNDGSSVLSEADPKPSPRARLIVRLGVRPAVLVRADGTGGTQKTEASTATAESAAARSSAAERPLHISSCIILSRACHLHRS
jgi:hypothetical protein